MRLLLDEQLPGTVAEAMRVVRIDCDAVGDPGCPSPGSHDDAVVEWCLQHGVVLVTADRGRKSREMLEALRRHNVPVLRLRNPPRAVPLLIARSSPTTTSRPAE